MESTETPQHKPSPKPTRHLPKTVILALVAALIACLLYALWVVRVDKPRQSTGQAATCTITASYANTCRPWLAVGVDDYPDAASDQKSQVLYHEKRIGKQVDAIKVYHRGDQNLNATDTFAATRANTFLMMNWKPTDGGSWASVYNGGSDTAIDNMAARIKGLAPHTVFLTLWHEPENNVSKDSCTGTADGASSGSPADFAKMYRYVHDRFVTKNKVTNVVWAMDYMNYSSGNKQYDCLVNLLYPGDAYVDWIVFNAYQHNTTTSWSAKVGHFYDLLKQNSSGSHNYISKNWGIAEWSVQNNSNDAAARVKYINQAKTSLESNEFPNVKSYMVFDAIEPQVTKVDYRIGYAGGSKNADVAAAYKAFANSPAFSSASTSPPPAGDTTPPKITITAPGNGTTVSGINTITTNPTDNVGIAKVTLAVDNTSIKNDTDGSDGWATQWTTTKFSNGAHTVKVVAYDAAGNTATASSDIVINNSGAPVINSFTASPASISSGGKSTLSWSSANASGCSITPGGPANVTSTSWTTGTLTATTTFTLACGTATKTVTVSIVPPPAITSFKATPSPITVGNTSTLSWTTANTVNCSVTPGGPVNTTTSSWTTLTMSSAGTTNYTLACKNSVGATTTAATSLVVNQPASPPANIVLSASATTIAKGSNVNLNWTSSGSSSCTLNPGNFTATGTAASRTISNLQTTTSYTVSCTNSAGTRTSNAVTVTVSETAPPPAAPVIISFVATPSSLSGSGTVVLSWQTSNVVTSGCALLPSSLSGTNGSGQWTTPVLVNSISYTLTCKNSANQTTSKSLAVTVAGQAAPAAPAPTPVDEIDSEGDSDATVQATTGQSVTNTQATGSVTQGDLATLDPSTISDQKEVDTIVKVEFYNGDQLIQTATTAPFALDTSSLEPGNYTITERVYFKDGSNLQHTQLISIKKKPQAAKKSPIILIIVISVGGLLLAITGVFLIRRRLRHRFDHHMMGLGSNGSPNVGMTPPAMPYDDPDLRGVTVVKPTVITPTPPSSPTPSSQPLVGPGTSGSVPPSSGADPQ